MISLSLTIKVSSGSRKKIISFRKAWLESANVLQHISPFSSNANKKQVNLLFEKNNVSTKSLKFGLCGKLNKKLNTFWSLLDFWKEKQKTLLKSKYFITHFSLLQKVKCIKMTLLSLH